MLDLAGYDLSGMTTLRLRGGAPSPDQAFETPTVNGQGRKRKTQADESPCRIRERLDACFSDIDTNILECRAVIDEMTRVSKCGKTWKDQIAHFLDEIMISSRKVAMESADAIGQISARKEDLREAQFANGDLYTEIGSLRERIRTLENSLAEKERGSDQVTTGAPTIDYMVIDDDTVQVEEVTPKPGTSYAGKVQVKNSKNIGKKPITPSNKALGHREPFPPLAPTVSEVKTGKVPPVKKPRVKPTSKIKEKKADDKARATAAGPRFEIVGDQENWAEIRKSIEQKLNYPKVRITKKESGIILFPEDPEILAALRRTKSLAEKKPPLPRLIISGVDRLLEGDVLSWNLVN